jgi:DNA-binding CsgD family transcriptional regulator
VAAAVSLKAREATVLRLLACGCTYLQIADRLGVSMNTVATHVKNIYRKLEVRSARAAVWRAFELRLLARPQTQDARGAESASSTVATQPSTEPSTSTVIASSGGSSAAN